MKTMLVVITVLASFGSALPGQEGNALYRSEDVARPVPGETTLAGSDHGDITRFLNARAVRRPSLSPDGRQLAFLGMISGQPQLWVVDAHGGWPKQLTFGGPVTFLKWSPRGDQIFYAVDGVPGSGQAGFYLMAPDGSEDRELLAPADAYRGFGGFTHAGTSIGYATSERNGLDFDFHVIDVDTGRYREVMRGRMGLTVRSFRPDGSAVLLSEIRGENACDLSLFDLSTSSEETLFRPKHRSNYASFSWTPDGSSFYLVTDHEREFSMAARFDMAERTLHPVAAPNDRDVDQVALSGDGRYLAWVTNNAGYSGLHIRDLMSDEPIAAPILPRGVYSVHWATSAPVAAILVNGPQTPGDIWTWNAVTGKLHRATQSAAGGLNLQRMVIPQACQFSARDGVQLHGLLYLPADSSSPGQPPVVLSVHGGPTGQARPQFEAIHQYLLSRGIAVFDLNYRGSTGFGKTFAHLNDRRLRESELYDLADTAEWLAGRDDLDASRLAVMGTSYGGYLTMAALARLPEYFDAGVAHVGVSNWITALQGCTPQMKAADRVEYGDIDDPDDREFFRSISPITYVHQVRSPLLVIHGANDPQDPVTESDQFVHAVRQNGGNVQYVRFPDEGHSIQKLSNRIIAGRRISAFLEDRLQVKSTDLNAADTGR